MSNSRRERIQQRQRKFILIRWFISRILCLAHLGFTIFILRATQIARHLFFLPIIGIGLVFLEILLHGFLGFRSQNSFFLLLIYSAFIITSIWLLEIYTINHLIQQHHQQSIVEVFSQFYYSIIPSTDGFIIGNKYLWAEMQIQVYIFVMVLVRAFEAKSGDRYKTIVTYWTTAFDTLDFIHLLTYPKLYIDRRFVHLTLTIWTISCVQFLIPLSTIEKYLKKHHHHRLASIITYSLFSVIFIDFPYILIRLYAIFGVGKHDYTSYFLVFKNVVVILFAIADLRIHFLEIEKPRPPQAIV